MTTPTATCKLMMLVSAKWAIDPVLHFNSHSLLPILFTCLYSVQWPQACRPLAHRRSSAHPPLHTQADSIHNHTSNLNTARQRRQSQRHLYVTSAGNDMRAETISSDTL